MEQRACAWCGQRISAGKYCSKQHRQTAFRARKRLPSRAAAHEYSGDASSTPRGLGDVAPVPARSSLGAVRATRSAKAWARRVERLEGLDGRPRRLAIADPPYPRKAFLYRDQPTFAGEVDHRALLDQLATYDGWVLATSAEALRDLLPLCPPGTRISPWVKPHGVSSTTRGAHNCWEVLLYKPARELRPGFRDYLRALPARRGGTLIGRKPIAWVTFAIQLLGALPGDSLDDLFPGTGVVGRVWAQFQGQPSSNTHPPRR
jgi:hypothetical protein